MLQLVYLRWLAVAGQLGTIGLTQYLLRISLPLTAMLGVLAGLVALNGVSLLLLRAKWRVTNAALFIALLLDVAALSAQLYLSGGATNPFVSLFLLQVVLASVLLDRWSTWVVVAATSAAFAILTTVYRPIAEAPGTTPLFALHIQGMWVCFALVAVLLVWFVRRINGNLSARDRHLAELRRQAVEEDHVVRIGLLASGAAHELGTPLASLSVILGDWHRMPRIRQVAGLIEEVEEMQAEVQRCKAIVTGILMASGEARGEAAAATSVHQFFDRVVADWREARGYVQARYRRRVEPDVVIASDTVLQQVIFNILDNAAEASPGGMQIDLTRDQDMLVLTVADEGPGFTPDVLRDLGQPYNSTKPRTGAGLGLFLVNNVVRKLGGRFEVENRREGGALVTVIIPIDALELTEKPR